jgi:nucleoside-diphosphate-sugar epimerase
MNILVTGTEGYIGALLAPLLLQRGHEVVGLDTGYYRDGWLYSDSGCAPRFPAQINRDLRRVREQDLAGLDAVVHLAELSNDPLGQNNPDTTFKINHQGSVQLAANAKRAGVSRFVYTSSCSVYGIGSGEFLTEKGETNPQTAYATCKVLVERDVGALADARFSPTFLRNATAYGASPRMRFDIVLNNLCGLAFTTGRIAMVSDGSPWRPIVHVLDICNAIVCALEAPREAVHNQIFNVGRDDQNFRILEIAEIVANVFPGCQLTVGPAGGDHRSYRVSFEKIHSRLPGFAAGWTAQAGAKQLHEVFSRIAMPRETFEFRAFTRLKQLEYLISSGQLDSELYWKY